MLAGDRKGYKPVRSRNKSLLRIKDVRLIDYVVEALEYSRLVRDVYVIGPLERLSYLKRVPRFTKVAAVYDQRENIVQNVLYANDLMYPDGQNNPVLLISSDIPLVSPDEIDYFIANSGYQHCDYVMGFAEEAAIRPYYRDERRRGMRLSYIYTKQFAGRINNLHIAYPRVAAHPEYVDIFYNLRYQKQFLNYLKASWQVIRQYTDRAALLRLGFLLQTTLQLDRLGLYRLARMVGGTIDLHEAEQRISHALKIRFRIFHMDFGAAVLDIDSDRDLEAVRERFDHWMRLSRKIGRARSAVAPARDLKTAREGA